MRRIKSKDFFSSAAQTGTIDGLVTGVSHFGLTGLGERIAGATGKAITVAFNLQLHLQLHLQPQTQSFSTIPAASSLPATGATSVVLTVAAGNAVAAAAKVITLGGMTMGAPTAGSSSSFRSRTEALTTEKRCRSLFSGHICDRRFTTRNQHQGYAGFITKTNVGTTGYTRG
jgi:hypothetical protein